MDRWRRFYQLWFVLLFHIALCACECVCMCVCLFLFDFVAPLLLPSTVLQFALFAIDY